MSYRSHPCRTALALLLTVGGANACATAGGAGATMSAAEQSAQIAARVRTDEHIFAVLHTSNVGEIAAGMQAQQRGTDSAVKAFGAMMMTEHSTLDQQGNALASQLGVTPALPDNTLPQRQRVESDSLRAAASGAAFDRLYIAQQVIDHQRTLNLVDASIAMAQHAELRTALRSQVRPAVAAHLARAVEIQTRVGRA